MWGRKTTLPSLQKGSNRMACDLSGAARVAGGSTVAGLLPHGTPRGQGGAPARSEVRPLGHLGTGKGCS